MRRSALELLRSTSGAVAPTVALSLFGLIACGGIAFDYARMATLDTELQDAADQAALAAASQLDGENGACERAVAAAQSLVANKTLMANESNSNRAITIADPGVCDGDTGITYNANASIRFYQDIGKTTPSDDDSNAKFVEVTVDSRKAYFALTPIVAAYNSGDLAATAFAGLGQAICKTPPLMICNPHPGVTFDADALRGVGIQVTGHGNNDCNPSDPTCQASVHAWAPGDFGFLEVGGTNRDLIQALAFQDIPKDCLNITDQKPNTGNPQGVYDAINTRFDIQDFSSGAGTPLASCFDGACPAAADVAKDLIRTQTGPSAKCTTTANDKGWHLPPANQQFWPKNYLTLTGAPQEQINDTTHSPTIAAMGLPRDNCHYDSFGKSCSSYTGYTGSGKDRIGNGDWARWDYFAKYHPGSLPPNAATITRYQTYLWEIANNSIPNDATAGQHGTAVCSSGAIDPGTDRRVLSVAVVENCAELSGNSTPVDISDWVDMFLVEPTVDSRGNGSLKDSIYLEVIGKTGSGSSGTSAQTIRKAVPYLIE